MLRVTIAADAAVAADLAAELRHAGMHVTGLLEIAALEALVFASDRAAMHDLDVRAHVDLGAGAGSGVGEGIDLGVDPELAPDLDAELDPELQPPSADELLHHTDVLAVQCEGRGVRLLGAQLRGLCDRRGIRIVPLAASDDVRRRARALGLEGVADPAAPAAVIAAVLGEEHGGTRAERGEGEREPGTGHPTATPAGGRVFTVWGPGGAPGRSTVAIELAYELARGGRLVALVDADTQGPSLALALGLPDEGPGFAAACRAAGMGALDDEELERISLAVPHRDGSLRVLTGLNRPARWPELSEERVVETLRACRAWADYVVVDIAAPLEQDEEIVSDLDGLRRHAAGLGALRAADRVVAVASIEPIGMARFVRGFAELREVIGATPVAVIANRLRPGVLPADAKGQVRRMLARFAGIEAVSFVPLDPRSADAAMLAGTPIGAKLPNSPLACAVRRVAGDALLAPARGGEGRGKRAPRRDPEQGAARPSAATPSAAAPVRASRLPWRRGASQRAGTAAPAI